MATWASISETLAYTRINVEQEDLDSAQAMIELFADVIYEQSDKISTKNARLLKMAVAYQAAWITEHPDLFTHTDIQSINQDGIFYVHTHENSYLIAPMARRALKRLSWMRNKSIRVRPSRNKLLNRRVIDGNNPDIDWIGPENGISDTPDDDNNKTWSQL